MISRYNSVHKGTGGAGQTQYTNRDNGTALGTAALTIDIMFATPIFMAAGKLLNLAYEVTTGGGAGNKTRVGLFSNKRGDLLYPDKLLFESAEVDSTATGLKQTALTFDLDEGLYWFVLVNGAGTLATYRSVAVGGQADILGDTLAAPPVIQTMVKATKTYNAGGFAANMLTNSTFPTGGTYESTLTQPLVIWSYSK